MELQMRIVSRLLHYSMQIDVYAVSMIHLTTCFVLRTFPQEKLPGVAKALPKPS